MGKGWVHLSDPSREDGSLSSGPGRHSRIMESCSETKVGEIPRHCPGHPSKAASSYSSRSGVALLHLNHGKHHSVLPVPKG